MFPICGAATGGTQPPTWRTRTSTASLAPRVLSQSCEGRASSLCTELHLVRTGLARSRLIGRKMPRTPVPRIIRTSGSRLANDQMLQSLTVTAARRWVLGLAAFFSGFKFDMKSQIGFKGKTPLSAARWGRGKCIPKAWGAKCSSTPGDPSPLLPLHSCRKG